MSQILDSLRRNAKSLAMPLAMIVGAILYRPVAILEHATSNMITPLLIFLMLFTSLCRVEIRDMKIRRLHVVILLIQIVLCLVVYVVLAPLSTILAQGVLVCIMTPIAMSAIYIGGLLGANIASLASYSLLNNLVIAFIAPFILASVGDGECSFVHILSRITPLLILPFVLSQLFRVVAPRLTKWIGDHSSLSFIFWLVSLAIIMGRTTSYVLELGDSNIIIEGVLTFVALVICVSQFLFGRWLGRRYGEEVMAGQAMGQKNTLLAIWMAHSFLHPISSIAPTAYIVWQNVVNSFQIYRKEQRDRS